MCSRVGRGVWGPGCRVQGAGCRVQGSGCSVWGSGRFGCKASHALPWRKAGPL